MPRNPKPAAKVTTALRYARECPDCDGTPTGMKTMNRSTPSLETHIWNCRCIGRLTAILVALVGFPLVIDCQAQAPQQPPFDFSDAFYLANGINPANLLTHVDG